ncbi:hypothetical protein Aph01nite_50160 [Acrocarpospora phusangensis]|uniref:Uncharacterized protein n=1 Tax=Acrocarpospora phusangensis TaxID=1070424 RepID=A0A919QF03_9ACTN|nr:hypothetical protein [Acrocarpospora phusangensis]GIH26706.1 hypothetical protein Aph01nite_50160 [Acrocarpospora phusangensis]
MTQRIGAAAGAVALVTAALVVPASPAFAALPGLQRVPGASITFQSEDSKNVLVQCPSGKQAVGGAYWITTSAAASVAVISVIPTGNPPTGMSATAVETDSTSGNWQLALQVFCVNPLPGMELVSGPGSASNSAATRHAEAECDDGKVMTGSGFSVANGAGQVVVTSWQPRGVATSTPTSVGVQADEEDSYSGTWSLRAWAICANPISGLTVTSVSHASQDVDSQQITRTCASGKRLLSAGFHVSLTDPDAPAGQIGIHNLDVDMNPVGNQATEVEANGTRFDSNDEDWSLTAYAICATA